MTITPATNSTASITSTIKSSIAANNKSSHHHHHHLQNQYHHQHQHQFPLTDSGNMITTTLSNLKKQRSLSRCGVLANCENGSIIIGTVNNTTVGGNPNANLNHKVAGNSTSTSSTSYETLQSQQFNSNNLSGSNKSNLDLYNPNNNSNINGNNDNGYMNTILGSGQQDIHHPPLSHNSNMNSNNSASSMIENNGLVGEHHCFEVSSRNNSIQDSNGGGNGSCSGGYISNGSEMLSITNRFSGITGEVVSDSTSSRRCCILM